MKKPSVSEIPEHPYWKRVTEEVAYLLFDHGSKVYGSRRRPHGVLGRDRIEGALTHGVGRVVPATP